MKPLADQIEAIALGMERGELPERLASVRLREIAEKVRATIDSYETSYTCLRQRVAELESRGYTPDETQAPYIAEPVCEKYGEQMEMTEQEHEKLVKAVDDFINLGAGPEEMLDWALHLELLAAKLREAAG